jgi:hypothetical protein
MRPFAAALSIDVCTSLLQAAELTLSGISSITTHVVVTERQPKTQSAAYCLSKTSFNVMGFPSASTPDDV